MQENLGLGAGAGMGQQGLNVGWGDREMDVSREFMPVSRISKSKGFLTYEKMLEQQASQPHMPKILVSLASCVGVLYRRDPGIIKLGGETRSLTMLAMRTSANTFFLQPASHACLESRGSCPLGTWV